MIELISILAKEPNPNDSGDDVYDLAAIRQAAGRCVDLPGDGILAVRIEDEFHVSFAVFRLACGPATKNGVVVDGAKMELVFTGSGPSGNLRELRHTTWGDGGYIFYPPGKLIAAAFAALEEWFDVDHS